MTPRAIAKNSIAILFVEPTSALDPEMINEVLDVKIKIAEESMTMLVISHEIEFWRRVTNCTTFMDWGEVVEDRPTVDFFEGGGGERAALFLAKKLANPEADNSFQVRLVNQRVSFASNSNRLIAHLFLNTLSVVREFRTVQPVPRRGYYLLSLLERDAMHRDQCKRYWATVSGHEATFARRPVPLRSTS